MLGVEYNSDKMKFESQDYPGEYFLYDDLSDRVTGRFGSSVIEVTVSVGGYERRSTRTMIRTSRSAWKMVMPSIW